MNKRIAIYPGTFDPITLGHQDIIQRSSALCDQLLVCVAIGHHKTTLFALEERVNMVETVLQDMEIDCAIRVLPYEGLLVDVCRKMQAGLIVRGLRAVSDFEYEFQLAAMNRHLAPEIETVFLATSNEYSFLSSSVVKEIAKFGGPIDHLVPPHIALDVYRCQAKSPT